METPIRISCPERWITLGINSDKYYYMPIFAVTFEDTLPHLKCWIFINFLYNFVQLIILWRL